LSLSVAARVPAADDLTKPIHTSPDGHFLAKPDGSPFFYMAEDAEALLWAVSKEDADFYLRKRAEQGFTVTMGQIAPKDNINRPNYYGETVFVKGDPSHPNPKYFAHVDWVVARARHYGLRVTLAPVTGITHLAHDHIYTVENVERYGRWVGQRYRGQGIIWMIGFDSTPIWADGDWSDSTKVVLKDFRPVYDLLTRGITEGQGEDPFFTFHPSCCNFPGTAEPRTSLYLGNRPWLHMNMLQSSHFKDVSAFLKQSGLAFGWDSTFNYEPIRREYDSLPVRPVVDGEPQFDSMPRNEDGKVAAGRWDEVDIRNSAYHSVFAGAAGHDYNHLSVVHFFNSNDLNPNDGYKSEVSYYHPILNWKDALNALGAQQIGHVKALMLSRPYFTRIPDQSVIVGETGEGSAHISATRDREGSYLMIYLPQGQPVTVDMIKLSGAAASAWWFDPRAGTARRVEGSFPTDHQQRFMPPSQGAGNDWILVLDDKARNFPTPGSQYEQR